MAVFGTVIGVVLTAGVTYCSEKSDREAMARKIAVMTIHNLDVSIGSMSRLVDEMCRQDSLSQYVKDRMTQSRSVGPDTVQMFISGFYSHKIRPIDTSTESVFSSDFDIWRNIDDPKVIGRIANCYSLMRKCGEEYDRYEMEKYEAFIRLYDSLPRRAVGSDDEIVRAMLKQNDIGRIMESAPVQVALLRQLLQNAKALNDRNKTELGVSQEELDRVGKLM